MSVKFEFILSDIDASNLISILQDEIDRTNFKCLDFIKDPMTNADTTVGMLDWYNRRAQYLEGLKQNVLAGNSRVE